MSGGDVVHARLERVTGDAPGYPQQTIRDNLPTPRWSTNPRSAPTGSLEGAPRCAPIIPTGDESRGGYQLPRLQLCHLRILRRRDPRARRRLPPQCSLCATAAGSGATADLRHRNAIGRPGVSRWGLVPVWAGVGLGFRESRAYHVGHEKPREVIQSRWGVYARRKKAEHAGEVRAAKLSALQFPALYRLAPRVPSYRNRGDRPLHAILCSMAQSTTRLIANQRRHCISD
jgi:hypothetical protein